MVMLPWIKVNLEVGKGGSITHSRVSFFVVWG